MYVGYKTHLQSVYNSFQRLYMKGMGPLFENCLKNGGPYEK